MSAPQVDHSASLDYYKTSQLFEWTFAILVANLTLQAYRLAAQMVSYVFDMFKLSYSKEIFGPLTNDDLRPFAQYFLARNVLLFKLAESFVLTLVAFFLAKSLINLSIVGLCICSVVFVGHVIMLFLGAIYLYDQLRGLVSLESLLWFLTIAIESASVVMSVAVIASSASSV